VAFAAAIWIASMPCALSFTVLGEGNTSCGRWLEVGRTPDSPTLRLQLGAWINGYISAMNDEGVGGGSIAADVDADSLYAWIDNYCSANPSDKLYMAANSLIRKLLRRQKK
jgi:hypothetical protein